MEKYEYVEEKKKLREEINDVKISNIDESEKSAIISRLKDEIDEIRMKIFKNQK